MPAEGLFAGHDWRVSPAPFQLGSALAEELESLGRVLLQFYRSVNLLYRKSVEGKQPEWVARWLDQGKPAELLEVQRSPALKNELPRVIRPDLLITEHGISVTELDSVPGGIGLTAWLNQAYSKVGQASRLPSPGQPVGDRRDACPTLIGGADGMLRGFASIFGDAPAVHIVVSEEAATYRPEMVWAANQLGDSRFKVRDSKFDAFADGDAVYRFFELFDLANVPAAKTIIEHAVAKRIRLTPPPKPIFEEKLLFALLWNRHLQGFWRQELGDGFFHRMQRLVPYTWIVDPAPLPAHAAIPELNLTDWRQLLNLSHKERDLILKVSGFSPHAWGARGVFLGSNLSHADWAAAVERAIASFSQSPYVLQSYQKPSLVDAQWFDFDRNELVPMKGRVRLCPYYFVSGEAEAARAQPVRRAGNYLPCRQKDHSRHDRGYLRPLLAMNLFEYTLLAASSLFVIVDPLAAVPAFLAMTPTDTPEQRIKMARLACCVMAGVLLVFGIAGKWIFKFLGITMPAFQLAASIVLLLVALDMLRAQRSRVQETSEETAAGVEKTDIAVAPLAIPMLAGPGAISTSILLHNQATSMSQRAALYCAALYFCILVVSLASYLILRVSARGAQWLSPIAMSITARIMGLLLAAVALQFMLNALTELNVIGSQHPA